MIMINQNLYQFSTHIPQINPSFHQYLIPGEEPLLVHTGDAKQVEALLPQLEETLCGKNLKYTFISHFESDECGGLSLILARFPDAKAVCSEVTARQLSGFGLINEAIIKKPGDKLITDDYELEFFAYPSEMHLWEGLLAIDNMHQTFFSSDLMIRFGKEMGTVVVSDWNAEVMNIRPEQIPDPERRAQLQQSLLHLNPKFIATGHGPCISLSERTDNITLN